MRDRIKPQKTFVYIDGFNMYYGLVKRTPYKWLDIPSYLRYLFPKEFYDIRSIKYFTAPVDGHAQDPDQPIRQRTYWRALTSLGIELIKGRFLSNPTRMRLIDDQGVIGKSVQVLKTEEKGSDVNLATHLLLDAFEQKFDTAIVFTNDGDFVLPVKMVKEYFKKTIIVLYPKRTRRDYVTPALEKASSWVKEARVGTILGAFQLPETIRDAHGTIVKPEKWSNELGE